MERADTRDDPKARNSVNAFSVQDGDTAYAGTLGIGASTGQSSTTRQDIEDEVENTTSQINSLGSSATDQQQKKVLDAQLRMLQQKLSSM